MEYNTQQRKLPLPEYGRSVQNMVDHALTIEDRAERQRCVNAIINIMGGMFPHLRDVPDFKHKLWDHLAIMSDFKLDIDYPFAPPSPAILAGNPNKIPYNNGQITYKHYGRIVEMMIKRATEYPEGPEKESLVQMIADHMKKCYLTWNKETVDDEKVMSDFLELSKGQIEVREDFQLKETKDLLPQKPNNNSNNNNKKKQQHNNQKNRNQSYKKDQRKN